MTHFRQEKQSERRTSENRTIRYFFGSDKRFERNERNFVGAGLDKFLAYLWCILSKDLFDYTSLVSDLSCGSFMSAPWAMGVILLF